MWGTKTSNCVYLILTVVFCGSLFWTKRTIERITLTGEVGLDKELIAAAGDPRPADAAVETVLKAPCDETLWSVDSPELGATPSHEQVAEILAKNAGLSRAMNDAMVAGLETAGSDCLLNSEHQLQKARAHGKAAAGTFFALLAGERVEEALRLLEQGHRFGRIVGRGIGGTPSTIAKLVGMSMQTTFDKCVAAALERHLVPASALDALDRLYIDALRHETDFETATEADLQFTERAVRAIDRKLGPMAYPMRLFWGSGEAQVRRVRKLWSEGKRLPEGEIVGMHLGLAMALPNFPAAQERYDKRLSIRHGIRAAIALERARFRDGRYPDKAPANVLDPRDGKPYTLVVAGETLKLYGLGKDGLDAGGNPERDDVIWGPAPSQ